jgi:hypothetical protein
VWGEETAGGEEEEGEERLGGGEEGEEEAGEGLFAKSPSPDPSPKTLNLLVFRKDRRYCWASGKGRHIMRVF